MKRTFISVAQVAMVMPCAIALAVYTAQTGNGWPTWICVAVVVALITFAAVRANRKQSPK